MDPPTCVSQQSSDYSETPFFKFTETPLPLVLCLRRVLKVWNSPPPPLGVPGESGGITLWYFITAFKSFSYLMSTICRRRRPTSPSNCTRSGRILKPFHSSVAFRTTHECCAEKEVALPGVWPTSQTETTWRVPAGNAADTSSVASTRVWYSPFLTAYRWQIHLLECEELTGQRNYTLSK